jgi:crotonobetainyl-CoA:carnitine CoA-transferase CaiB-like acyl-CoA transferase
VELFLSGVRVLSLTHFLQGPSAVQLLADLGADVIKVEPPGRGAWERRWAGGRSFRDGESVFFLLANRNQRSLTLDLRTEAGKDVLRRLVRTADVLVENYRPGVLDRLGFGYDAVARLNPRVIYCSCSGYGPSGPYRDYPGQDLLVQAVSGLASLSGGADDPPVAVGTPVVDQHAAVLAAFGIVAALRGREQTGRGCRIDASLLAAALDLQIEPLNYHLNGGHLLPRSRFGLASTFHEAPYGIYRTRDGWIALSLSPISRLAELTGSPALAAFRDEESFVRREQIAAVLAAVLPDRTTQEWLDLFQPAGVWCMPVNDYSRLMEDPQVQHTLSLLHFDHPHAGPVRVLGHPLRYDGEAPPLRRRPPLLGEHTEEILREAGYTGEEIRRLRDERVV